MVRTQIQLTERQAATLRQMSVDRHTPIAELIRMSIDNFLRREAGSNRDAILVRARSVAGKFRSGTPNVSTDHDEYIADAFSGK